MNGEPNSLSSSQPMQAQESARAAAPEAVDRMDFRIRLAFVGISLVLYILACVLPALVFIGPNGQQNMDGFSALVIGWAAPLFGQFAWYANPLLLLSIIGLMRGWRITILLVALSLLLAADTFMLYSQRVPADESGSNYMTFQYPAIGFYLWIASMVVIGIGAVALPLRSKLMK